MVLLFVLLLLFWFVVWCFVLVFCFFFLVSGVVLFGVGVCGVWGYLFFWVGMWGLFGLFVGIVGFLLFVVCVELGGGWSCAGLFFWFGWCCLDVGGSCVSFVYSRAAWFWCFGCAVLGGLMFCAGFFEGFVETR